MEKRKEEEKNEKRRLLNQTKWIFMEYIEIKDMNHVFFFKNEWKELK